MEANAKTLARTRLPLEQHGSQKSAANSENESKGSHRTRSRIFSLDLTVTDATDRVQLGGELIRGSLNFVGRFFGTAARPNAVGKPHERVLHSTRVLDIARGGDGAKHILPALSATDGCEIRGRVGKVERTRIVTAGQRVHQVERALVSGVIDGVNVRIESKGERLVGTLRRIRIGERNSERKKRRDSKELIGERKQHREGLLGGLVAWQSNKKQGEGRIFVVNKHWFTGWGLFNYSRSLGCLDRELKT